MKSLKLYLASSKWKDYFWRQLHHSYLDGRPAITPNVENAQMLMHAIPQPVAPTITCKAVDEATIVRENVVMLIRLKDMRRRMMQIEHARNEAFDASDFTNTKECHPLNPLILESVAIPPQRQSPPSRAISSSQARTVRC